MKYSGSTRPNVIVGLRIHQRCNKRRQQAAEQIRTRRGELVGEQLLNIDRVEIGHPMGWRLVIALSPSVDLPVVSFRRLLVAFRIAHWRR
jgi:hypothetical protein